MKVFKDVNFKLNIEDFKEKVRIGDNQELYDNLKELLAEVLPIIKPKAIYEVSFVEDRYEQSVKIDGVEFNSRILCENLANLERVFPYIVTCGDELEEYIENITDYLEKYWFDILKEEAMRSAQNYLKKYIKEKYKIEQIASMNPGSGDIDLWPLSEQKKLFSIFGDTEKLIGVKLTNSFLMLPNKSLSGIYFPTDIKYVNCQKCKRKNCPNRKAPYQGEH